MAAVATVPRSGAASGGFNPQADTPSRIRLPQRNARCQPSYGHQPTSFSYSAKQWQARLSLIHRLLPR